MTDMIDEIQDSLVATIHDWSMALECMTGAITGCFSGQQECSWITALARHQAFRRANNRMSMGIEWDAFACAHGPQNYSWNHVLAEHLNALTYNAVTLGIWTVIMTIVVATFLWPLFEEVFLFLLLPMNRRQV
jgi:hypothetical protein